MVREPDATRQPTPQDNQLMSKHRVLSFKPQLRLEWRGQDGQSETKQPDHSDSLGDSITSSTRIRFSVHTSSRNCRRTGSSIVSISERYPRRSNIPSRLSGGPWERRWLLFASGEPSIRTTLRRSWHAAKLASIDTQHRSLG